MKTHNKAFGTRSPATRYATNRVPARLGMDERCRVLLVEAGPGYPAVADLPADIADESIPATSHDWGFASEPDELGRSVPLPRGRLVGGCSATNACFAVRGWPQDYGCR